MLDKGLVLSDSDIIKCFDELQSKGFIEFNGLDICYLN